MRFIGSKKKLLPFIEKAIARYVNDDSRVVGDVFSGTGVVSRLLKSLGFRIIANDNLQFCLSLAHAILNINKDPRFESLIKSEVIDFNDNYEIFPSVYDSVLNYLNNLPGIEGFIYANYSPGGTKGAEFQRQYFSDENAKKIDAIRQTIDQWKRNGLLTTAEESLIIADLLKATNRIANTSGTYGCFNKDWDKRAFKTLHLERSEITPGRDDHELFSMDANEITKKKTFDILYLDPPYTWRHYGAYYHILETIAVNDSPEVAGKTGLRPWQNSRSRYCDRKDAANAFKELIVSAKTRHVFMSYNSEGLISHEEIMDILSSRGEPVCNEIAYRRYRSNNSGNTSNIVKERLYYVKIS